MEQKRVNECIANYVFHKLFIIIVNHIQGTVTQIENINRTFKNRSLQTLTDDA